MFQRTGSETEVDARLIYMSDNVNRWLQFAEAKNGVALTASGGALFAILGISCSGETGDKWRLPLAVLAMGLVVVMGLSLLSFWPKLVIENDTSKREHQREQAHTTGFNLLFYGHIRLFSLPAYQKQIQLLLRLDHPLNEWQSALVGQVWTNARIAYRKYAFFNGALVAILVSFVIAVDCFLRWY